MAILRKVGRRGRVPRRARGGTGGLVLLGLLLVVAAGCTNPPPGDGGAPPPEAGPEGPPTAVLPPAPWAGAALRPADVPGVYLEQWQKAENRGSCALIAPRELGVGEGASPRAATFAGGWAVAYDQPELRSAFGVAGAGIGADAATYEWPNAIAWADGSSAGYGPEGGSGPNQLAYVRVAGQECLYNVWSRLGVEHLEYLLGELRFVGGASP